MNDLEILLGKVKKSQADLAVAESNYNAAQEQIATLGKQLIDSFGTDDVETLNKVLAGESVRSLLLSKA